MYWFILKNKITESSFFKYFNNDLCDGIECLYPYDELENEIMSIYYNDPLSKYIIEYVRLNKSEFNKK